MDPYDSMSYEEYQKTEYWYDMRQKRLEIDGFCCAMCGTPASESDRLQLHHNWYPERGTEDVQNDLVMLCRRCHKLVSGIQKGEIACKEAKKAITYAEGAMSILNEYYTDGLGNWCANELRKNNIIIPSDRTNKAASVLLNAMYGMNGTNRYISSSMLYPEPEKVFFTNTSITKLSAYNKVQKAIKWVREKACSA